MDPPRQTIKENDRFRQAIENTIALREGKND